MGHDCSLQVSCMNKITQARSVMILSFWKQREAVMSGLFQQTSVLNKGNVSESLIKKYQPCNMIASIREQCSLLLTMFTKENKKLTRFYIQHSNDYFQMLLSEIHP